MNVTGRPAPAITWSKPGVDLHNRGFIDINTTSTTLIIDKVHRYDAGKYTLVAENSAGKQEVSILVKVYGKLTLTLIYLLLLHWLHMMYYILEMLDLTTKCIDSLTDNSNTFMYYNIVRSSLDFFVHHRKDKK